MEIVQNIAFIGAKMEDLCYCKLESFEPIGIMLSGNDRAI